MRRRPLRLALAALGFAAAVYGAASLTGGWLGTPPWWEQREVGAEWRPEHDWVEPKGQIPPGGFDVDRNFHLAQRVEVEATPDGKRWSVMYFNRDGREWVSAAVIATGLGLAAFVVRPRKSVPAPQSPGSG